MFATLSGEWTRAGSESGISGIGIDATTGSIDAHHQSPTPSHHLTSTPLRSVGDRNKSKVLPSTAKGIMYSPCVTPIPSNQEAKGDGQGSGMKKISQGSDCQSFADSGFACDRTDSMIDYDGSADNVNREGRRSHR